MNQQQRSNSSNIGLAGKIAIFGIALVCLSCGGYTLTSNSDVFACTCIGIVVFTIGGFLALIGENGKRVENSASKLSDGRDLPASDLPRYKTSRRRYPRPNTNSLAVLQDMSLQQVGRAQSNVDAWWPAADLALYRWELLRRYDEETCRWVQSITYDLLAAKQSSDTLNAALWSWEHIVELFQYCYSRMLAIAPTVDRNQRMEVLAVQGYRNFFAWALYRSLQNCEDVDRLNAFEPELYNTLRSSSPESRTAEQNNLLQLLQFRYESGIE